MPTACPIPKGNPMVMGHELKSSRSSSPQIRTHNRRQSPTSRAYRLSLSSKTSRNYEPHASIVLVGFRGTGLSSLAVMAASALSFRLIDADQHFYQTTGLSRAKFKAENGSAQYRQKELALLRSMLLDNTNDTVLVCGPGAVDQEGQELLREYSKSHPIIYVMRDIDGIKEHLGAQDTLKISELARLSALTLRTFSNFEFYNLSHPIMSGRNQSQGSVNGRSSPRSLALKQVELDFLHLLKSVTARETPLSSLSHHDLQSVPLESRPYTYALVLPLSLREPFESEFGDEDVTADAVELIFSLSEIISSTPGLDIPSANLITRQYYAVKRELRLPVIFTVEGRELDEHTYFDVLRHALRLGPEFVSVDLESDDDHIRALMAAKGQTRIIAHQQDSSGSPDGWLDSSRIDRIDQAEKLGADVVRLCQEATSQADNFAVQHFIHQAMASPSHRISLIAYNTGSLGRMSMYLNSILSPVTYDTLRLDSASRRQRDHLLTTQQVQTALYRSLMLDPMYFSIYGNNVTSSLSPAMHNAAFNYNGMPHRYKAFRHDSLEELKGMIKDHNFGGASITAPFKTEVMGLIDHLSPEAQAIGAVNTLVPLRSASMSSLRDRNRAGPAVSIFGDNSDWVGIRSCVQHNLSPINAVRRKTTALVVGAGGMARAATYALIRMGVRNIMIQNRSIRSAEALVEHFQSYSSSLGQGRDMSSSSDSREPSPDPSYGHSVIRILKSKSEVWPENFNLPTIVISCVATKSVDGGSNVDTSLPPTWLASPTGGVAIELSYNPLETPLIKQVRELDEHGWIAVDGLQVLPEQGKLQFELFTARKAPIKLMRKEVLSAYERRSVQISP